ncbi:hypothetical protein CROQUDRAFT_322392 [Cronartium quercuum f. sp. fusiforme G11]|uniref:Telomerase reverse transcriptase n=1 Tax=Cronartium quercuum f. sp. fusiforme G11 TaxID=708437 RepID=A0A9P6NBJ5_9BASI|nr:hypothetical protein CROQUDRAFT_322392 [Cronartium quercuum f. sp. fusiforme G11]
MATSLKNVIFSDQVKYPCITKEKLLVLLKEHVTENFVKIGCQTYRQKVGIPQGSVISPILCSLYYADMDRTCLDFTNNAHSVSWLLVLFHLLLIYIYIYGSYLF